MLLRLLSPTLLVCLLSASVPAADWPAFRGANGDGVSSEKGIPVTWSEGNYRWNIELPGAGHAAPVIHGNRVYVTSASDKGLVRTLYCLDADSGKEVWSRSIAMSESHKHAKSSWASSTPVTDGQVVYVAFADQEKYLVNAYDTTSGELLWRRNLGAFESQHGLGVSLMFFEDTLIAANDQDGPSFITALDRKTGDTRWSTLRDIERVSYATPVLAEGPNGPQLICASGAMGITSLNPRTGELNWRSQSFPQRTVATPVVGEGLVIASCGQAGKGVNQIAVGLDGKLNEQGLAKLVWERKKVIPYVPTPVVYNGLLFEWGDDGVVGCADLKTGEDVWSKRVGGNYSGSPICIDGKLYCISEKGEVVVIGAEREFKEYGRTNLNDGSHSTPAVANGRLYLRTFSRLMCLDAQK